MGAPVHDPTDPQVRIVPQPAELKAGTALWRCHGVAHPAASFKDKPTESLFKGGRFDATPSDPFPFLYAAEHPAAALSEVLLRDVPFGDGPDGERLVPWARASRYALTRVTTVEPLRLIRLVTEGDLAAVSQTAWLLEADGLGYAHTRAWGAAMRRNAAWAQGIVWPSRRCRHQMAYLLFGDRCAAGGLRAVEEESYLLGTAEGAREANRILAGEGLRSLISEPEG